LLQSQAARKSNNKSGDTDELKEFSGGSIMFGTLENHNDIADFSVKYGFHDDYDRNRDESKEAGDTDDLIQGRYSAYGGQFKIFKVSTPLLKTGSKIEFNYLRGDQRKYMVPCPCCHEMIEILWKPEQGGGMVWEKDNHDLLITSSVGYVCQLCAGYFKDNKKVHMLENGLWVPTAEPKRPGDYSYHISSLYSPPGMVRWDEYVQVWLDAHPKGGRIESKYQTFRNTVEGFTYEDEGIQLNATEIQKNIRGYEVGTVPEKQSIRDGNGKIVLLTLGSDLNGIENDVRLDWEVLAHAESGATYSVAHGSIGTWQRGDADNNERQKWDSKDNAQLCVWPELDKLIAQPWQGDNGLLFEIAFAGVDTGFHTNDVYSYLERTPNFQKVIGIRGSKEKQFIRRDINTKLFVIGTSRRDEYFVQVGYIKDDIASYMQLQWDKGCDQPTNFMNFPQPSGGKYTYRNYFSHFESEQRKYVTAKDGTLSFKWDKITSASVNHMWDCRVYNMALREIFVKQIGDHLKEKVFLWPDFVGYVNEVRNS
jgi:phage terminase large subunit GpA-like protein